MPKCPGDGCDHGECLTQQELREHVEGCGRDHDAGDGDCYTRDDWLADEGDRKYDEIKDRRFDGPDDD